MAPKVKKLRAGRTKTALNDIYQIDGAGYSARGVVDLFKAKHTDVMAAEKEELLDMALMLLAGRVAAAPIIDPAIRSLFGDDVPKALTEVRSKVGGKMHPRKIPTHKVTPKVWLERHQARPRETTGNQRHSDDMVDEIVKKMIAEGMPEDMTIEEYKRRK